MPKSSSMPTISKITRRRFIMGQQGLWPGRRWSGKAGIAEAIRYCEDIQIDPVNIVCRSHDLALWGRVDHYKPEDLDTLIHQDRQFFDYGGTLYLYPMEELPYWRTHMERRKDHKYWHQFFAESDAALESVQQELRTRGPLGTADFKEKRNLDAYRSGKVSGVALYYLWLTGELMTHRRKNFNRIFDFRHNVAPPDYHHAVSPEEAEHFFAGKALREWGMATDKAWRGNFAAFVQRKVTPEEIKALANAMVEAGEVAAVKVEGEKDIYYLPAVHLPLLETLQKGELPDAWKPVGTNTTEEVTFFSPLELVSARGRAKKLFDFEYLWEIYKPQEKRRWGPYTMPILYGDQLVARIDLRMERKIHTLVLTGFWLEDEAMANDEPFAKALARGLKRFMGLTKAKHLDLAVMGACIVRETAEKNV